MRRKPQTIASIVPEFNKNEFNFNKISKKEFLFSIPFSNVNLSFLINNSPLTKYHTLICPDVEGNHSQVLNIESITIAIELLLLFNDR